MKFLYHCREGNVKVIKLLLTDVRVDVNIPNKEGWTPLMNAVNKKNIKIVQLLVDKGADISQISEEIKKMLKIPRFKEKAGQKLELEKEVYNS